MIEARIATGLVVHPDGSLSIAMEGRGPDGVVTVLLRAPPNLDRSKIQLEAILPDRIHSLSLDGRGHRHALGSDGHIWTDRMGTEWAALQVGDEQLTGIRCFQDEIFVVGEKGLRLRADWAGQQNQRYLDGQEPYFRALAGPRDNMWAVGDGGAMARFDGERWSFAKGFPEIDLRAVAVLPSAVWVAGAQGAFWSLQGENWDDHSADELKSVTFCGFGAAKDAAFMAAGGDGLCRVSPEGLRFEDWNQPCTGLVQGRGVLYLLGGDELGIHDGERILRVSLGVQVDGGAPPEA
jgi:hypothetical protein